MRFGWYTSSQRSRECRYHSGSERVQAGASIGKKSVCSTLAHWEKTCWMQSHVSRATSTVGFGRPPHGAVAGSFASEHARPSEQ